MDKLFKVSEVFGHARLGKYHNPSMLVENESGYPYICASNDNNGISKTMPRVVSRLGTDMKDLTLTPSRIIAWGKQCPKFCYHDEPCVTSQGMYFLDMTDYNEEICLYVCAVLQGTCGTKYNYSNCLIGSRLDKEIISLPVIESPDPDHEYTVDDIDWQYMQDRIAELEQDRIAELDAYLKATGLEDYTLTEEDRKVLSKKPSYASFEIGSVFEPLKVGFIGKGQKIGSATKEPDEEHCVPLTCAKIGDNGIMYWGKKGDFITYKNTLAVIADGAVSAGLVYAQPEEAGAYSHSYFIDTKTKGVSKYAKEYLSTVLTKVVYPKYSREDAPRWNKIEKDVIYLPVTSNGDIDFDYMERYILAIEKLTIADVVKYRDQELYAAKQAVCY